MSERSVVIIEEVVKETEDIITLRFRYDGHFLPGQYIMMWIPGIDEIPMSLSYLGRMKGVTVKKVGEATKALCSLKVGDQIGVRGPFGQGFAISEERTLCVGGGVGMAAIMPAVTSFKDRRLVDVAIGAPTKSELLFEDRAIGNCREVIVSTDDGSKGFHGTVVDMIKPMLESGEYQMLLGCGPELMLDALHKVCMKAGVESQLSLERFIKCGVGLCGSCAINGIRVCADGPVFWGSELTKCSEFGKYKRDQSGRKTRL
ncbi:MAG: dihydroorotate dehydrogenase electron transfer subunit [Methanomassiliicoccales archaeon]|nr:dihydroorotate dehydrogenase electron transfer subunit [Methanomassiliicoccales archaeon]NYT15352.1 dihydroorotate dehydrogenase electron transfer subunit [Methanomassiliicoccales archaeon]